ncbi:MAG: response regulator [Halothece sp. Uz-M2-17]|nr:response regulator [Halothece sp. Uz-M2-17]
MFHVLKSPWENTLSAPFVIIEDSDEDFYVFLRALKNLEPDLESRYPLLRFREGDEALDYLLRQEEYHSLEAPLPVALLLDLNLPGTDGREIIQEIKQNSTLQPIPIIVLTTSSSPRDIETCYRHGANSYILKPMGAAKMQQTVQLLFQYWFHLTILPIIHDQFMS